MIEFSLKPFCKKKKKTLQMQTNDTIPLGKASLIRLWCFDYKIHTENRTHICPIRRFKYLWNIDVILAVLFFFFSPVKCNIVCSGLKPSSVWVTFNLSNIWKKKNGVARKKCLQKDSISRTLWIWLRLTVPFFRSCVRFLKVQSERNIPYYITSENHLTSTH